jgi:hypothetical protein
MDNETIDLATETTTDSTRSPAVGGEELEWTTSEEEEENFMEHTLDAQNGDQDRRTSNDEERQHSDTVTGWTSYLSKKDMRAISTVSTIWFGIAVNFQIAMSREEDENGEKLEEHEVEDKIRRLAGEGPISVFELIGRYIEAKGEEDSDDEYDPTDEKLYEYQVEAQNAISKLMQKGKLKTRGGPGGLLELEPDGD